MSSWDIGGSIADTLARLVSSPRVQYGVGQLKNQLPQISGPISTGPVSPFGASSSNRNASGVFSPHTNPSGALGATLNGIGSLLGGGQQQQQDPLMTLYQNLIDQLRQPVNAPSPIDTAALMKQVQDAINPIYDQRAKSAEDRTGRYTKDVQGMYGQLAKDYEQLAPQQIAQANDAQKQIESLYGQLRSNIEGSYSRVSNEQSDLFKQLGIESALPAVLTAQQPTITDATTAASENQAQQQQRYMDIGQMDSTYYREGAPNSVARGNEESTNLLNQLQDYLGQVDAERTSGIQSGYLDQLGQAQNQYAQQQQSANSETDRRQQMLWQMLQSQLSGNSQQQALTPDTFMSQLPSNIQQQVAGAFTSLQRSPEAVYGKVEDPRNPVPGTYVDTSPQWYMAQADKMLQSGQIDPTTYQALQMYMQLYFKTGQ